jgi:methionyl-tRNA formyltransferase
MLSHLGSSSVRFVIVGAGKTAVDITQIIAKNCGAELVALLGDSQKDTTHSSLPVEAKKLGIPYLETKTLSDDRALDFVKEAKPDYIVSANNFLLFRQAMLDIPSISTVN